MKNPWLSKAMQYILKDTGEANESPKLIVVIRILLLSMLLYVVINSIIYISILNNIGFVFLLASLIMFTFIFSMTYRRKTTVVVYTLNLSMAVWIIGSILYLGWDTGVQHFIIVLLVLSFFSGYSNYGTKAFYAAVLCCFRIYLYFLCRSRDPIILLTNSMTNTLQVINTIAIFWCLSIIAYVFSKDSQTLEGKLIEYNNILEDQANTDALTGLFNRRKAMQYLEELITPSNKEFTSICICDIDFFKKVNDNYGHDIGDIVLQNISDVMVTTLDKSFHVARWGGEEFLLIFPACNGDDAFLHLEQLRSQIKSLKFNANGTPFSITMTFGLAEYDFRSDIDTIIKEADEKLYIGKENGRDQIVY